MLENNQGTTIFHNTRKKYPIYLTVSDGTNTCNTKAYTVQGKLCRMCKQRVIHVENNIKVKSVLKLLKFKQHFLFACFLAYMFDMFPVVEDLISMYHAQSLFPVQLKEKWASI